MVKSKKFFMLISLASILVFMSACDGQRVLNFRINLKDGRNSSNENGYGRFNENRSPKLCTVKKK